MENTNSNKKSNPGKWLVFSLLIAGGALFLLFSQPARQKVSSSQPAPVVPPSQQSVESSGPEQQAAKPDSGSGSVAQVKPVEGTVPVQTGSLQTGAVQTGLGGSASTGSLPSGQSVSGAAALQNSQGVGKVQVGAVGAVQGAASLPVGLGVVKGTQPLALTPAEIEMKKQIAAQEAALRSAGCVLVSYQAKLSPRDGANRYTKNKLKLTDEARAAKELCVRVDGTPVKFSYSSGHREEVVIGTVPKPNSQVTIRYCRGGTHCSETCVVPRDEFMDALAGDDGSEHSAAAAHWDPKSQGASAEEVAADKELDAMADVLSEDHKPGVFSSWLAERQTPACEGKTQAKLAAQGRRTASTK